MKHFNRIDTLFGWLTFAIAVTVYALTIEPTASFWDCPEFILSGYKLEVGHPPGAPFFMLTANLFSQFASSPDDVARMVNLMSALLSALTILFLFWTISHLVRRLLDPISSHEGDTLVSVKTNEAPSGAVGRASFSLRKLILIEASAFVGSLIYTFSDTFWFSAVEGEVYAFSSAFTAAVFWLALKWEEHADEPQSDRWLVLIAYLMGLSIGVHLLNLLCLPAIVLVFYHRRYPGGRRFGTLLALAFSFLLIAVILFGIIPGVCTLGGWCELLLVNGLGFRFNTGLILYLIILFPLLFAAIVYTQRHCMRVANTSLLCLLMLLLGYGSYAVTFVRASANTPMNQNAPKDIFALGRYLARDQYEHGPLLYGQAYTSQPRLRVEGNYCVPDVNEGKAIYQRKPKESEGEKDQYIVTAHHSDYRYEQQMLFPRMWNPRHAQAYEAWTGGNHGRETWYDRCGESVPVRMPSQWDNLRFFLSYQCNFMYWRYFLWNFAGRQNDLQSHGEPEHGNWLSGFAPLDNWRLGDQRLLPDELQHNRGHNVYYCLPLLLGIIGIVWQLCANGRRGVRQCHVVGLLFLMTGLAIVVYLNQTPGQPRERDYAYAGSFYAFAVWCGMGVAGLSDLLRRVLSSGLSRLPVLKHRHVLPPRHANLALAVLAAVASLSVPLRMASENWDDHDRSGRYICADAGHNYLASLPAEGNPVILTNGDNDTFPLWYAQEVEGFRTDARVCNMSYLQTDWYIDQLRRQAYDSPALPIEWDPADYITGRNDAYDLHDLSSDTLELGNQWRIPLHGRRVLYKQELALTELLRHSSQRPLYVATSMGEDDYLNLQDYTVVEGLAARFTPQPDSVPRMDTAKTYDLLMHHFRFRGINDPAVYHDETARGMAYRYRRLFVQLALHLISEHDDDRARNVLRRADTVVPLSTVPADFLMGSDLDVARAYALIGDSQQAAVRIRLLWRSAVQMLSFYLSPSPSAVAASAERCSRQLYFMRRILEVAEATGMPEAGSMRSTFQTLADQLANLF